jgi:hypothetical protein
MTEKVILEMTPEQALSVIKGLDLAVRIGIGQIEEIAQKARDGILKARNGTEAGEMPSTEQCENIEALLKEIKAILGHPLNGSYGIGSPSVSLETKRQYEVEKALQKVMAEKQHPGRSTVWHDGNLVRYTGDDFPEARLETIGG